MNKNPKGNTLTIDRLNKIYQEINKLYREDDFIIKTWQYPFLWLLYWLKGYKTHHEGVTLWFVDFRGTKYLIKESYYEPKT